MKTTESQTKQIFDFLMTGCRLNGMQALTMFKTWRLPARILNVKKTYGVDVKTDMITVPGSRKKVAEYYIQKQTVSC